MKLIDKIREDAKESLLFFNEKDFIENMNLITSENNEVTYRRKGKGIKKINKNYSMEFLDIHSDGDYLCRLNDCSVIQAYYKFDESQEILIEASLKYYPNPGLEKGILYELLLEDNMEERKNFIEVFTYDENFKRSSNYIRIDYKPKDFNEIIHPCTHIHIGAKNELRLNVDRVPLVSEFIEFILFSYYKEEWFKCLFNMKGKIDFKQKDFLKENDIDIERYLKLRERKIKDCIDGKLTEKEQKMYTIKI